MHTKAYNTVQGLQVNSLPTAVMIVDMTDVELQPRTVQPLLVVSPIYC